MGMTDSNKPNMNASTHAPGLSRAGLSRTPSSPTKRPTGLSGSRPSSIPGTQRRASQIMNGIGIPGQSPADARTPGSTIPLPLTQSSSGQADASQKPMSASSEVPVVAQGAPEQSMAASAQDDQTDPSVQAYAPSEEAAPAEEEAKVKGQLPVGMKIDDRYEITGILGVGGFATVYKAHHLMIDRDVALKVMDLQKGVDKSYTERFFREAKIAAKIHHNNVVQIYDFGFVSETQQPYIAMEMLRGHDLAHELQEKGPLSPKRAFVLFRPVLDALAEGHRFGIVHKDLKPENLFLTDPGGPHEMMKVLDFGVARIDSGEVAKLTSAGQLLGTPRYLAPEYIKNQLVTPAIDVYQMALILSEALIGVSAANGDPFHAMMLHCTGDLTLADFLLEGEVGNVYKKAVCVEHTERYQNCEEFARALDTVEPYFESNIPLKGGVPQTIPERHVSSKVVGMPSAPTAIPASTSISGETNVEDPQANSRKKIIVIAVLAVVIAGVVALIIGKSGSTEEEEKTKEVAAEPAPQPVEEKLTFNFTSEPAGAKIMLGDFELCKAPCSYSFDKNTMNIVTFVLDGYVSKNETLNSTIYEFNKGDVKVTLQKGARPPIKFEFSLTPDDVEAELYIDSKYYGFCKGTCDYDFAPDSVPEDGVELILRTKGYKDFQLQLTEDLDPKVSVTLEKEPAAKRPATRKTTGTSTGTASSQPSPAPASPPKKEKKQKIQLITLPPSGN